MLTFQEIHLTDRALFAQRCVSFSDVLHMGSFVNTLSPCIRGVIVVVELVWDCPKQPAGETELILCMLTLI